MINIPFQELYNSEFFIKKLLVIGQKWYVTRHYSCIGNPAPSHTLLWFRNCHGKITDKKGKEAVIEKNQIVYTAKGSEYVIEFYDTAPNQANTICFHFELTNSEGQDIIPVMAPFICTKKIDISLAVLMENALNEFNKNIVCIPEITSVIYQIFSFICQNQRTKLVKGKYQYIRKGIELLENNSDKTLDEIAKICGVSEGYFRKLFREYSGENPIEFRQRYRIEKSKQLLLLNTYSIGEIAEELHFSDIYHFSKTFKKMVGVSPRQYIEQHQLT